MIGFKLIQYRMLAVEIMQTYDYGDIQKGIAYLKNNTQKVKTDTPQDCLKYVDYYFRQLITWLQENGKEV